MNLIEKSIIVTLSIMIAAIIVALGISIVSERWVDLSVWINGIDYVRAGVLR